MELDRRSFFGSLTSLLEKSRKTVLIRPPGSSKESDFTRCAECEAPCVASCEEGIIVLESGGYPYLDFSSGGCTYCGECIKACPTGVLCDDEERRQIEAKLEINPLKCIAWNQTICSLCKDPCLERAIEFLGLFRPEIAAQKCTNCGFCIGVCPTGAIEVSYG